MPCPLPAITTSHRPSWLLCRAAPSSPSAWTPHPRTAPTRTRLSATAPPTCGPALPALPSPAVLAIHLQVFAMHRPLGPVPAAGPIAEAEPPCLWLCHSIQLRPGGPLGLPGWPLPSRSEPCPCPYPPSVARPVPLALCLLRGWPPAHEPGGGLAGPGPGNGQSGAGGGAHLKTAAARTG